MIIHSAETIVPERVRPSIQVSTGQTTDVEAARVRELVIQALHRSGGGHYGGSLSIIDVLVVLYRTSLHVDPTRSDHPLRDRFILSKGHAAIALYAVLSQLSFFAAADLARYAAFDSFLEGHPDSTSVPGVDFSTGSLGQGLAAGLGMAIGLRDPGCRVWVVLGDGECQEGSVWEAAMLADRYRVANLHAIVDANGHQEYGWPPNSVSEGGIPVVDAAEKWRAFGWNVFPVDGHDHRQLAEAMRMMRATEGGPSVVIAKTRKGFGFHLFESNPTRFHCATLTDDEAAQIFGHQETVGQ